MAQDLWILLLGGDCGTGFVASTAGNGKLIVWDFNVRPLEIVSAHQSGI